MAEPVWDIAVRPVNPVSSEATRPVFEDVAPEHLRVLLETAEELVPVSIWELLTNRGGRMQVLERESYVLLGGRCAWIDPAGLGRIRVLAQSRGVATEELFGFTEQTDA